ncbi:MFS transporter [Frankia canadensis]|nr:MFS transporter [Frankia canadensis]
MVWQLLVWAAGAGAAGALAVVCRPAAAAARHHGSVPGTVPAATGALAVLVVTGLALTAFTGLPTWAGVCWLLGTAAAAGWIALRRRDPAAWGLATAADRPPADAPELAAAELATASQPAASQPAVAVEAPRRMSPDLADQDDLVQSLTIASYALQMGDAGRARQAVEAALSRSRATLDLLLREDAGRGFVRSTPAAQSSAGPTAA